MSQLGNGEITVVTGIIWVLLAAVVGAAGGALGGLKLGGKDLGKELASMMGAFFGPLASLPGVVLGLIVLALIK